MVTKTEPIDAVAVEVARELEIADTESRALVFNAETVALPIPVDEAIRQWEQYQELTRRLLDDSDYQSIGSKRFKKKSAWRKYARAFNITDRVTAEEVHRDEGGFPLWARLRVEARAMNGRTAEADHECHRAERCCERPCRKASWKDHSCCPADCDGKLHWAHPGDIPATALTRAKNRAISDLIGAGEVSAEEMHGQREAPARAPQRSGPIKQANPPSCPMHGMRTMRLWAAGVSKKTGKPYDAFWACNDKTCTDGFNGKQFSVTKDAWDAMSAAEHNTEDPMTDEEAFGNMPNE